MGRLKSAVYDFQMRLAGARLSQLRRDVVAQTFGLVLEVGVGTGLNIEFYPPGAWIVAVDPDNAALRRAQRRCAQSPARVQLLAAGGEALPFPDGTFDEVVATLVFCTVPSPALSLREVRRVLKPGGAFRFMEHVRSPHPGWARLQDLVTPIWRVMADGCCPNRATVAAIEAAGFVIESLVSYPFGPYPVRPQVRGIARPAA
jgi:ubiquinone/menaquinone biosynthesis C-methylase UbiE